MGTYPVYTREIEPKVDELASVLGDVCTEFDFNSIILEFYIEGEDATWPPTLILVTPKYRPHVLVLTNEDKEVLDVYTRETQGWIDIAYNILGVATSETETPIEKIAKIVIKVYEKE